jgi:hypothetical protein
VTRATERPPGADSDGLSALAGVAPVGVPSVTIAPSVPPTGLFMTADHRYYMNGTGPMPSVTTILEVLSKPALVQWLAKEAARACIRNWSELATVLETEGEEKAVNWAVAKGGETRDRAARLGTGVHYLADVVAREDAAGAAVTALEPSETEKPYVDAFRNFMAFLGRSGGSIVSSEHAVWSQNGYAGTYDLILHMPRHDLSPHDGSIPPSECTICRASQELWLVDIKTSKGFYPEYGLQLAAYRWADSIILPNDPTFYSMPLIQRTAVLHLRPDQYPVDGYRLVEYPTTYEDDFMTFLGALEIHKWRKQNRFSKKQLLTGSQEDLTTASAILLPPKVTGTKQPDTEDLAGS